MTYVLNQLSEPRLASHEAFRATDDIIAVGQKTSEVGRGVWLHIKNVPHVFGARQWTPLQGKSECRVLGGNRDEEFADALAFCAPHAQADGVAGTVADFGCKERRVGIVLGRTVSQASG